MKILSDMKMQNQIKRTLSEPETVEYVSDLLEERDFSSRSELVLPAK